MNGDILTNVDFKKMLEFHQSESAVATMGVREYENQIPYGVVNTHGSDIIDIEEKPLQRFSVSAGIYILNPSCLNFIPNDEFFDMPTLFEKVIADKQNVKAYPIKDYWIDIGHTDEFEQANKDYKRFFDA